MRKNREQIRNNVTHNGLDVKIIGAGGGFSYNVQGISHNTSEDISISIIDLIFLYSVNFYQ